MKIRSLFLSVGIAAAGLAFPAAVSPSVACAATADSAALVVDTGSSVTRYCVEIPRGGTDGIGLIKLAAQQYGLSYNLGFGGAAVCALNGVGVTSSSDCFADMPNFWGYYIGNGSGGWSWSGTGAGSISVDPGDIQAWSWGVGKDGSSHPQPPSTTYEDVCTVKQSTGDGGGAGGGSGGNDKGGASDSGNATGNGNTSGDRDSNPAPANDDEPTTSGDTSEEDPAGAGTEKDEPANHDRGAGSGAGTNGAAEADDPASGTAAALAVPIVDASPVSMATVSEPPSAGPPAGALLVLAAAAALLAAGAFMMKRPRGKHARR
jgi:hypothetical protein